jgi:hypothetical protein
VFLPGTMIGISAIMIAPIWVSNTPGPEVDKPRGAIHDPGHAFPHVLAADVPGGVRRKSGGAWHNRCACPTGAPGPG